MDLDPEQAKILFQKLINPPPEGDEEWWCFVNGANYGHDVAAKPACFYPNYVKNPVAAEGTLDDTFGPVLCSEFKVPTLVKTFVPTEPEEIFASPAPVETFEPIVPEFWEPKRFDCGFMVVSNLPVYSEPPKVPEEHGDSDYDSVPELGCFDYGDSDDDDIETPYDRPCHEGDTPASIMSI